MGNITGASFNKFKSAEFIYSKIKRELKSFGNVNLLDDADFPLYTAEVLKRLGISAYREEDAVLLVKNGKASLPKDFMQLHAAYKCKCENVKRTHKMGETVVYEDTYTDILSHLNGCKIECTESTLVERITVRQYIDTDTCYTYDYIGTGLLKLSPNVKAMCTDNCLNFISSSLSEITINNGCIYTNFKDEDIYLKYHAFPFDEDGNIMIPDVIEVEKAVEWYIKKELLLNYWLVDDVTNIQNKWQKAEQEFEKWFAEAKYINKLPAFSTLINDVRTRRGINKVAFFSQMDNKR